MLAILAYTDIQVKFEFVRAYQEVCIHLFLSNWVGGGRENTIQMYPGCVSVRRVASGMAT